MKLLFSRVASLSIVSVLVCLAACEDVDVVKKDCPAEFQDEEPCRSFLQLTMQKAGAAGLPPGDYLFKVVYDGEDVGIRCVLTGDPMVTCQAFDPPPTSPAEWNIPQVIITEGLPTGWLFDVPGTPETLEVEVKYQNEVSAQLTLEPDYEEQRAHEKCPVLCETAVETIELTFITTD